MIIYFAKMITRCKRFLRNTLYFVGITSVDQLFNLSRESNSANTILVIGHGEILIPSNAWGAVETVIFEMNKLLFENNFQVSTLNSKSVFTWLRARRSGYDTILLHDDSKVRQTRILWPLSKIILITHYGNAAFPDKWTKKYLQNINKTFHLANKIVCLSPAIYSTFLNYFDSKKLIYSPNGTKFSTQLPSTLPVNRYICLGKVEERKKQFELYEYLSKKRVDIDFYGPIIDQRVTNILERNPASQKFFKGPISRPMLTKILPTYTALVHMSDAEADALVLYEAQVAGLPIIISPN